MGKLKTGHVADAALTFAILFNIVTESGQHYLIQYHDITKSTTPQYSITVLQQYETITFPLLLLSHAVGHHLFHNAILLPTTRLLPVSRPLSTSASPPSPLSLSGLENSALRSLSICHIPG